MNFGDILDKWESSQKGQIVDKDAEAEKQEAKEKSRRASYIQKLSPQATLDLHGKNQEEAWKALNDFVAAAKRQGLQKILIIHGKGIHSADSEGVLGGVVRKFIEGDQRLGASGSADKFHGGSGATWVAVRP
ncbi:MAG: Smr/MutS family protein [Treponema sp.]|nr:Smr/MutS family protein [Treponema sp.]